MASPQVENGYTQIANEIVDALCRFHPGGAEGQILLAIIRKTYGWHKSKDKISIMQLSEITGLARRTVIYAIKNLEAKNMIKVIRARIDERNEVNLISFQKNYELWVVQEMDGSARKSASYKATIQKQKEKYKTRGSARNSGVVQETVPDCQFLAPTKETITKERRSIVPFQEILKLYHAVLPELPRVVKLSEKRKTQIKARWMESDKTKSLEWWKSFFELVHKTPFLMGENGRGWKADLEFLTRQEPFLKVIEGKYV